MSYNLAGNRRFPITIISKHSIYIMVKMGMFLHGSSAPRYTPPPSNQPTIKLPNGGLGLLSLPMINSVRNGMTINMMDRIANARPGCSSCGGGSH